MNFTGKRDGFLAIDLAQEHNIKDIKVLFLLWFREMCTLSSRLMKVTWRSCGPGATFAYLQKISPAIPTLRAVKACIVSQFSAAIGRGARHTTQSKDADVRRVIQMYQEAGVLDRQKARSLQLGDKDRAPNVMTDGASHDGLHALHARWWDDRRFKRATTEVYHL